MLARVAAAVDAGTITEFFAKYAVDKAETSVVDLAVRPVVRFLQRRLGVRTVDQQQLYVELAAEVGRVFAYAGCLGDRVAQLERSRDISDADLRRRLRAPSTMHMIERGAQGATETADRAAAVILAELVTSRLRCDEDTSVARSLQRAVVVASELSTADLLLLGGIALVTVPDAVNDAYRKFVQSHSLEIYRSLLNSALPKLFVHPPLMIQLTDLESIGVLVHQPRETPGEPMQARSPIEQLVTGALGEVLPQGGGESWMRPGSSLSRAARLAVPSDDGVTVSEREPVLVNYTLTTVGWHLAEAVLRGAVQLDVRIANQLHM